MVNLASFLETNALLYGNKPAIVSPKTGEILSYRELLDRVKRFAEGLHSYIKKGDRVIVGTGSRIETIISYFAVWRLGGVAVPVNPDFKGEELSLIISDSEPRCIIALESLCSIIPEHYLKEIPLISVGNSKRMIGFEDLLNSPPYTRLEECSIEDLCHIQYTSGTTGRPKGAMLTHANWMAALENERWALRLTENDIYLGFYPHFHIGVSWGITALRYGATFVLMERFNLEEFLRLAKDYGATILSGMPPVLYALVHAPPEANEHLRQARCIITGGAPTPDGIWGKFRARYPHIEVVNAYGLSETVVLGAGTAVPVGYQHLSKGFKSVGLPVGYCEVKVVDERDPSRELPRGQVGEIALRGPGVAKGYWKRSEETKSAFLQDGWFLTGDLGYMDEEGVLYITSRKKDVIIMSGWKIYPGEVESILMRHPKIAEAAVFAKYDEIRGEIPAAAIVLKRGDQATAEEILSFCRERMAGFKVPRHIIFLDELPKMGGWKIMRRTLREVYGGFPESRITEWGDTRAVGVRGSSRDFCKQVQLYAQDPSQGIEQPKRDPSNA